MNLKEVSELRRRFRMDRNAISRIYGCFVNSSREIVSYIDESMGILPQDEAEKYLNLLKKVLSGKLGKNLIDIIFSTEQLIRQEIPVEPHDYPVPWVLTERGLYEDGIPAPLG